MYLIKNILLQFFIISFILNIVLNTSAEEPVINEFMAINDSTLQDEDLDYSDWIEISNTSTTTLNIAGWYLTDSTNDLTKWQFPATNLQAEGFMIVFASGKDRAIAGAELHTNFKLSGYGEYLALVKPDGQTIAYDYAPQFPIQKSDISYGISFGTTNVIIIPEEADCTAIVPQDDSLGTNWLARNFDDSSWTNGTTGVGYEYGSLININLQSEMKDINGSAYIRIPFVVSHTGEIAELILNMKFEDGFTAYINGTEVAASNAPASPTWNSLSVRDRADALAVNFERFDISASASLITTGTNLLAIQLMNKSLDSSDILAMPQLTAVIRTEISTNTLHYFITPTPGAENTIGAPPPAPPVIFSQQNGIFTEPIATEIFTEEPADEIRYTTDGSEPSATSAIYSGAITNTTTTIIRARSFVTGYAPGPINSRYTYRHCR